MVRKDVIVMHLAHIEYLLFISQHCTAICRDNHISYDLTNNRSSMGVLGKRRIK